MIVPSATLDQLLRRLSAALMDIMPLWGAGLLLLALYLGDHFVIIPRQLSGEPEDWMHFALVGTAVPVLLIAFAAIGRWRFVAAFMQRIYQGLALMFLAMGGTLAIESGHLYLLIAAAGQVAIYVCLGSRELMSVSRLLVAVAVGFASWMAAISWLYWAP